MVSLLRGISGLQHGFISLHIGVASLLNVNVSLNIDVAGLLRGNVNDLGLAKKRRKQLHQRLYQAHQRRLNGRAASWVRHPENGNRPRRQRPTIHQISQAPMIPA